jgi:F-type H+-transporting ATPase subunit b
MIIDATFWVAISFLIFIALLIYFKIPLKVKNILDDNINKIRQQVDESEKLKEEAKNKLAEYEKKIDSSKIEVKKMIEKANEKAEKNILASNEIFHNQMELKKKNFEDKIKQLKNQAIKDVSNASINIAFESIEKLMLNSLDKSKLDKIFNKSLEETKLALQKKSS